MLSRDVTDFLYVGPMLLVFATGLLAKSGARIRHYALALIAGVFLLWNVAEYVYHARNNFDFIIICLVLFVVNLLLVLKRPASGASENGQVE